MNTLDRIVLSTMALALVVIVVLAQHGCGGAAVRQQARAADAVARAFNDVARPALVGAYETTCRAAVERACPAPPCDREVLTRALDACDERWVPLFAAYEAAKAAHDTWRATLTRCQGAADAGPCALDLGRDGAAFVEAATGFRCALRTLGRRDLDPLPGEPQCGGRDGG